MKKAFSIIEILIVVSILGIIAAVVVPQFQDHTINAKAAVAKDNLMILRGVIELYALQHGDIPPGYMNNLELPGIMIPNQLTWYTNQIGETSLTKSQTYCHGPYLKKMPVNPFNNKSTILSLIETDPFPETPYGTYGWIYKAATKDIRIDWLGTDKDGIQFYDY